MTTLPNNSFDQFAAWISGGKPRNMDGAPIADERKRVTMAEAKATVDQLARAKQRLTRSRETMARKPTDPRPRARRENTRAASARAFIRARRESGLERPLAKTLNEQFGITRSWARSLIREEYGLCTQRDWTRGKMMDDTIERQARIRDYLKTCVVRPTQAEIAKRFHVGLRAAQDLISEKFGRYTQHGRKSPGSGRRSQRRAARETAPKTAHKAVSHD